jgi:hypothetical protein
MLMGRMYSSPGTTILTRHSQLAVYPVLLPIYLMRYDLQIPAVPEGISFACMVQAHSQDVREPPSPLHRFTLIMHAGFDIYR